MSGANRFGTHFQVTTFGESHGPALGCVIDGCPAGVAVSAEKIAAWMHRRRPGQAPWVSARSEPDEVEILSGVLEGRTLGTPIAAMIRNLDPRSEDYQSVSEALDRGEIARPGHADDLWRKKHGHSDVRGGGRASGRETAARVVAGAFAEAYVTSRLGAAPRVLGFAAQIGPMELPAAERTAFLEAATHGVWPADVFAARFPSPQGSMAAAEFLTTAVENGESCGGIAEIVLRGLPLGLGEPVFHKFKSDLAMALMSVGATTGFEVGEGFRAGGAKGTDFHSAEAAENPYGGIRGGLTTGEDVVVRVAFKPTSTVMDLAKRGRHDPCVVPRAIPVLEAMAWLVIADHLLWSSSHHSARSGDNCLVDIGNAKG